MQPQAETSTRFSPGVAPKILLAKPSPNVASSSRGDGGSKQRVPLGNLKILTESWEFCGERLKQLFTENTEFMVIGVIGRPGAGKSTILNNFYGVKSKGSKIPPFPMQTEETKSGTKVCTKGVDVRVTAERIVLLDSQAIFSASGILDSLRPDGTSLTGLTKQPFLPADLAARMKDIQLAMFMCSVCNFVIVLCEGLEDVAMWRFMSSVEMLKHNIPKPSIPDNPPNSFKPSTQPSKRVDKDDTPASEQIVPDYFARVAFVPTMLKGDSCSADGIREMGSNLADLFPSPPFSTAFPLQYPGYEFTNQKQLHGVSFWALSWFESDPTSEGRIESFSTSLLRMRNEVIGTQRISFGKGVSEKDWLRSLGIIWEAIRNSPVLAEYAKHLHSTLC